jgi:hypothetical protein
MKRFYATSTETGNTRSFTTLRDRDGWIAASPGNRRPANHKEYIRKNNPLLDQATLASRAVQR